ncbi:MAG: NAD(P)H-hydrate dehydratase [Fibrobacterota bacterium]
MIHLVTPEQMQKIDSISIGGDVSTGFEYMKEAAERIFSVVHSYCIRHTIRRITVFCGKGNNGGDGFYVAFLLRQTGYDALPVCLVPRSELSGEAARAHDAYTQSYEDIPCVSSMDDLAALPRPQLYIEALLGTGIRGEPRGMAAHCIAHMNAQSIPVIAVDNPAGVDALTGNVAHNALQAEATVTLGYPKIGQLFADPVHMGDLIAGKLSYDPGVADSCGGDVFQLEDRDIVRMVPDRKFFGSKYDHGTLLAFTGSRGMSGAAALAAEASLRTGCGMVYCAVPRGIVHTLAIKITEAVLLGVDETDEGSIRNADIPGGVWKKATALLIGCGLSSHEETGSCVRDILKATSIPCVLDGDGLRAFAEYKNDLARRDNIIITPHYGEYTALFGMLPSAGNERTASLQRTAQEYGITIVFKGMPTIIALPSGRIVVSRYGNTGLATGGTGDVLAGIIASLLAQGASCEDASCAGVCLHGKAAELHGADECDYSLIASDLPRRLGQAFSWFFHR